MAIWKPALPESDHVVEWRTKREENTVAGVEPQSCTAVYNADGYLDLWIKNQPINAPSEVATEGITDYTKISMTVPYQGSMVRRYLLASLAQYVHNHGFYCC